MQSSLTLLNIVSEIPVSFSLAARTIYRSVASFSDLRKPFERENFAIAKYGYINASHIILGIIDDSCRTQIYLVQRIMQWPLPEDLQSHEYTKKSLCVGARCRKPP